MATSFTDDSGCRGGSTPSWMVLGPHQGAAAAPGSHCDQQPHGPACRHVATPGLGRNTWHRCDIIPPPPWENNMKIPKFDGNKVQPHRQCRQAQFCHLLNWQFLRLSDRAHTPPPFFLATQKSQINTVPTPTVAWTRPWLARTTYMVSWCEKGEYNAQIIPKSELCGFKWANTHNKCVHDPM